jgi:ferric-dicitrate binding protein FerR (iron transport regulator)
VLVPGDDQGAAVVTLDELAVMMLSEDTDELTFELIAGACSVTVEGQALILVAGAARIRALNASFSVGDGVLSVTEGSVELDLRGARVVGAGASVSLLPASNSALLGK